jgi:hypothetical protein
MRIGTNHFTSTASAIKYYRQYRYTRLEDHRTVDDTARAVAYKIEMGEIKFGPPPLKDGQRCFIGSEGRYIIEDIEEPALVEEPITKGGDEVTMPELMNCPHSGDGWCLSCVRTMNTNLTARIKALESLGPMIERLLSKPTYAEELGIRTHIERVLRGENWKAPGPDFDPHQMMSDMVNGVPVPYTPDDAVTNYQVLPSVFKRRSLDPNADYFEHKKKSLPQAEGVAGASPLEVAAENAEAVAEVTEAVAELYKAMPITKGILRSMSSDQSRGFARAADALRSAEAEDSAGNTSAGGLAYLMGFLAVDPSPTTNPVFAQCESCRETKQLAEGGSVPVCEECNELWKAADAQVKALKPPRYPVGKPIRDDEYDDIVRSDDDVPNGWPN